MSRRVRLQPLSNLSYSSELIPLWSSSRSLGHVKLEEVQALETFILRQRTSSGVHRDVRSSLLPFTSCVVPSSSCIISDCILRSRGFVYNTAIHCRPKARRPSMPAVTKSVISRQLVHIQNVVSILYILRSLPAHSTYTPRAIVPEAAYSDRTEMPDTVPGFAESPTSTHSD